MRGQYRLRNRNPRPRRLGECLDKRREIGTGISKQIFDPALGEQCKIGLRHISDRELLTGHWSISSKGC